MNKSLLSFVLFVVVAAFIAGCILVPAGHGPGPRPAVRAVPPPLLPPPPPLP